MLKRAGAWSIALALVLPALVLLACGDDPTASDAEEAADATEQTLGGAAPPAPAPQPDAATPPPGPPTDPLQRSLRLDEIWTGDLDGIAKRGRLRVLVTYSRTNYFIDEGGRPRGVTYELVEEFKKYLNQKLGRRRQPLVAVYIPVARDELLPELARGRGDLAAANLSITGSRAQQVGFSVPILEGEREVVVTGPAAPPIQTLDDLSGVEVFARPSSSFHESLVGLNARLRERGLAPVAILEAPETLETEDILELVNAGTTSATVADGHMAGFWGDVLPDLSVRDDLVLRENVEIAWALREETPQLEEAVNEFLRDHRKGTLFGNVVLKRYLKANPWVRNARAEQERRRLESMLELFEKYSAQYEFEPLLVAAQAYQESGLDHSTVSPAGAVGVMQVLPSTAASHEVGIPDIEDLESNIHAGIKYLRVLVDRYFDDPELDELNRHLFAFAGYNAGPNRIQRLRREAESRGLDPNRWFENVEMVVAERVGSEPVRYVSNIYKYFIAYSLAEKNETQRREQMQRLSGAMQ